MKENRIDVITKLQSRISIDIYVSDILDLLMTVWDIDNCVYKFLRDLWDLQGQPRYLIYIDR